MPMGNRDFQLKGTTITVVVLELNTYDPSDFPIQLAKKVQQAPQFFEGSPVLINVKKLAADNIIFDIALLIKQCQNLGLQPIAFKGASGSLGEAITEAGLASLPESSTRAKTSALKVLASEVEKPVNDDQPPQAESVVIKTVVEETFVHRPSKIISRPVRSGQKVYAEGADLIVLSQVGQGAEVLADGNIHIYGALRGRALAGALGDTNARIFCQQMDPELIAVAGNFLLSESLDESISKKPAQVSLQDGVLYVVPL
jgi:septum site-determining protein MinC